MMPGNRQNSTYGPSRTQLRPLSSRPSRHLHHRWPLHHDPAQRLRAFRAASPSRARLHSPSWLGRVTSAVDHPFTLLFPSDLKDYANYEDYFISRRKWFFGFLAATFLADLVDTSLKGSSYLHSFGIEYPIRIIVNLAICAVAIATGNRRVQLTLLAVSFLYHIALINLIYRTQ